LSFLPALLGHFLHLHCMHNWSQVNARDSPAPSVPGCHH
jgi:hypothetical protein